MKVLIIPDVHLKPAPGQTGMVEYPNLTQERFICCSQSRINKLPSEFITLKYILTKGERGIAKREQ